MQIKRNILTQIDYFTIEGLLLFDLWINKLKNEIANIRILQYIFNSFFFGKTKEN